jgi:Zn-dependent protease with chaperone function
MKTLLRAVILLLIVLWLGGVMFFPVLAAASFSSTPDTHIAGTIVRKCLLILHYEGLFAGTLLVILLLAAGRVGAYTRKVTAPVIFALIMLVLTAFSQFWIIPRMENYRLAVGGAIDRVATTNSDRIAFNKLHVISERIEEGVLLAGIILLALVARD